MQDCKIRPYRHCFIQTVGLVSIKWFFGSASQHDPNMQRWFSARVTYAEYLKPSTRGVLVTSVFFGTAALIYYALACRRVSSVVAFLILAYL